MTMEYFRRPQIAGNNLPYTNYAKLRGSIRRHDAGNNSDVPYFADVIAGQAINFSIWNGSGSVQTYVVTLTGNDISTVIANIHAATSSPGVITFSTLATVIDDDGALSVQLNSAGGNRWIEVTGGDAAAGLGFDVRLGKQIATGGDLESAPHGRLGNPANTALITRGENLSSSSVDRVAGRLASNSDVLYADLMRSDAALQKVASFVIAGDGTYITPAASTRVFTGGSLSGLTKSSTKEDLAPYFFIMDTVTKQPTAARVTAVTKGSPGNPAVNCVLWSGTGNVLGQQLVKQGPVNISDVLDGRTILLGTAASADIVVGDFLKVAGCTNVTPLDNSLIGWVIEAIDGARTTLTVRPMSEVELVNHGWDITDRRQSQPMVELNSHKELTETFGTASIYNGPFTTNVNLLVTPSLPPNASVELWAAQPSSLREVGQWEQAKQNYPASIGPQSDLDTEPNTILKAPTLTNLGSGNLGVGGYYVRWHGRVCYVPGSTVAVATSGFVYWDEHTCLTSFAATLGTKLNKDQYPDPTSAGAAAAGDKGIVICRAINTAGTVTWYNSTRVLGASSVVTVGWGGDFPTIEQAVNYLYHIGAANSETEATAANYPHHEVVVISNVTLSQVTTLPPKLHIRGATKNVTITIDNSVSGQAAFYLHGTTELSLENLTLVNTDATRDLAFRPSNFTMKNVVMPTPSVADDYFRCLCANQDGSKIVVENCVLNTARGLAWSPNIKDIVLKDSTFRSLDTGATAQAISFSASAPTTSSFSSIDSLLINNCLFSAWPANGLNIKVLCSVNTVTGNVRVSDSKFTFSGTPITGSCLLALPSGVVDGCTVGAGSFSPTVDSPIVMAPGTVSNCTIFARPQGSGIGVYATDVLNNVVYCQDSLTGQTNNKAIRGNYVYGNTVTGYVGIGIDCAGSCIDNNLLLSVGTYTTTLIAGISLSSTYNTVTGNVVNTDYFPTAGAAAIKASGSLSYATIADNIIYPDHDQIGISLASPSKVSVTGNSIVTLTGTNCTGIKLTSPTDVSLSGNTIDLTASAVPAPGSTAYVATGTGSLTISGSDARAAAAVSADSTITVRATGCKFYCTSSTLTGEFSNNRFSGAVTFEGSNRVTGNTFDASVVSAGVTLSHFITNCDSEITGNSFVGVNGSGTSFTYSSGNPSNAIISNNQFAGGPVIVNPWAGSRVLFHGNSVSTGTFYLSTGWGGLAMVGNTIETLAIDSPEVADTRVILSNNYCGSLTVAVKDGDGNPSSAIPGAYLQAKGNIFNYNVVIPNLGPISGFSGNTVMGNLSLANGGISSSEISGTLGSSVSVRLAGTRVGGAATMATLEASSSDFSSTLSATSGKISACTVSGAATLPNCFISDSYFGSTVGAVGDMHLANSTVVGAATVGQTGAAGFSPRNSTQTYISGTNFGSNLVVEGVITLSDVRCTGYLQTPSLGARPDDYRHEIKASNVVVEDSSANSLKLQSCDIVELSSVRAAGTATLSGYTTTKVSNFTGTAISAATGTSAENYVVLDGIDLTGNLTVSSAGVVNVSNLRCSGEVDLTSTSSISVVSSRILNSIAIGTAQCRLCGVELGQGITFTGSATSANCLVSDVTCNAAEFKMSGVLYGGGVDISNFQSRDWLKVTSFSYVNISNATVTNYADLAKDTNVKIDSLSITDLALMSADRQLGNVMINKITGRSIMILGGSFWNYSNVSITNCMLNGGTDGNGESYQPILIQGPTNGTETGPRFVIANNVLRSTNVHTTELPVECLAMGRGSGYFVSPAVTGNQMTLTTPAGSWAGAGTGHIAACMTVDAGMHQGIIANNIFRYQAGDGALEHKALKVYDNVPGSTTKLSGNLGTDTDGHIASSYPSKVKGYNWICWGGNDGSTPSGASYGVISTFFNFHTPDEITPD